MKILKYLTSKYSRFSKQFILDLVDDLGTDQVCKKYVALVLQDGINPVVPTFTVLENTIGNIVWTRNSAGVYTGTLSGAFTSNKVVTIATVSASAPAIILSVDRASISTIIINVYDTVAVGFTDNAMNPAPASIEIRIYP